MKGCSPVAEEHLDLLIVGGEVTLGVGAGILVLSAPLVPRRRQLVGRQRAGARSEGAGDDHAALAIPALVGLQHLGMRCHILQQCTTVLRSCDGWICNILEGAAAMTAHGPNTPN